MKIKCNYCGAMINETAQNCPNCGAALSGANRVADKQPKTIEELQQWYNAHHLPPEQTTRFFIGKNITEPKAFGIYKDVNGDCVVYKNKANGERAIRYQGTDEAYAVNELYQRLKEEIVNQKQRNVKNTPVSLKQTEIKQTEKSPKKPKDHPKKRKTNKSKPPEKKTKDLWKVYLVGVCLLFYLIIQFLPGTFFDIFSKSAPNGYYRFQGTEYYYQGSTWYYYDADADSWYKSDQSLSDRINKDNAHNYRFDGHQGKSFESTSWYDDGYHNDDHDWDNDNDWDSGDDWDGGGTDWDSDW